MTFKSLLARALVRTCGLLEWLQQPCGTLESSVSSENLSAPERHAFGVQLLELAGGEGGGAGDEVVSRQAVEESAVSGGKVRRR